MIKKAITLIVVVLSFSISTFGQDTCESIIEKSKKLGLVSYLITIKTVSEQKMISLAQDPQYSTKKDEARQFRAEYNMIKLYVDQVISQLSVDMIEKNKLKKYKKVNKCLKDNSYSNSISAYQNVLVTIDKMVIAFSEKDFSSKAAIPPLEEIVGALELVHATITDARDFREKKISNIITLLKDLKLQSVKDLTEEKEKKEEDKKDGK